MTTTTTRKPECQHFTRDGRERRPMPDGTTTVLTKPNPSWTPREKQEHFDRQHREWLAVTWKRGWPSTKTCRNTPWEFPQCFTEATT